jgi:hypothetical protein
MSAVLWYVKFEFIVRVQREFRRDYLSVNLPGRWTGRGSITWPPRSPDLTPLDFFLWGCTNDQVYSQRANALDELKARITAAIANVTKDMLQRVWQGWTIGGMYVELHVTPSVKCFAPKNFSAYV